MQLQGKTHQAAAAALPETIQVLKSLSKTQVEM